VGKTADDFANLYRRTHEDIFAFCDALNFSPTCQQAVVLKAVEEATFGVASNWIAVKSGQGPGKTTVASIIALWRSWRAYNSKTVVTAPTMRQCRDVFLVETRTRLDAADPSISRFFNATKTKIEIMGNPDWGVKLVTATKEENAQGYHDPNLTVIVEEASGVPEPIITQFKGTLSNPNALFLQIGNPNTRASQFYKCFYGPNKKRWRRFTFNAEDTASLYPHIVNPQRNTDLEIEFGRESDVYRVRVLGEFPHSDPNCIISSEDAWACADEKQLVKCRLMPRVDSRQIARQIGIDVARFGGDESTIYRRIGQSIIEWKKFLHVEPTEVVAAAFEMQRRATWNDKDTYYVLDSDGMGQGCLGLFYSAGKNIDEWHTAGVASEPDYANRATQGWFSLAKRMRERKCYIPPDPVLIDQLTTRFYFIDNKGRLILEKKDDYKDRGFDSPDRADGCIEAFWDDVNGMQFGSVDTPTENKRDIRVRSS